jgi:hypothetical protein
MSNLPGGRRERRAYNKELYVNRNKEIELVLDKCKTGRGNDPIPRPVVCFWGGRGIGKSWLQLELERRLQRMNPPRLEGDTACARLDLDPSVSEESLWKSGPLDRTRLLRELWRQLAGQAGAYVEPAEDKPDAWWAQQFVAYVVGLMDYDLTPVILLDSVDELVLGDPESYDWLEEHVLEQLAITDRVVLVLSSRGKPTYVQRWQMRRRVEDIEKAHLRAFNERHTRLQAKQVTDATEGLFAYSHGYPLVTAFLADDVQQLHGGLNDAAANPTLQSAVKNILQGVERERAEIARWISVLRRVDIEPVRAVLAAAGHPLAQGSERAIDDLILALRNDHLLYWDGERKTYAFDAALRRVLADALRLAERSDFEKAISAAGLFYFARMNSVQAYLPSDLHEYLFARCLALRAQEAGEAAVREVFKELRELPALAGRAELLDALEQDKELAALLPAGATAHLQSILTAQPAAWHSQRHSTAGGTA